MPADLRILLGVAAGVGRTQPMPATVRSFDRLRQREVFRAPHPLRTTLLALTPGLVPAALWATGVASTGIATATGGVLLGLAGVRGGLAWLDAWRCRRLADRLLRSNPRSTVSSPLADWRATQLTSERTRRHLVKWVQSLIRETELSLGAASSPLNRPAVQQSLFLLRRLERRLSDVSCAVSPYGILVVGELLADGFSSPLYWPEGAAELPDALTRALAALDVQR